MDELENQGSPNRELPEQVLRLKAIAYATRIVGTPQYFEVGGVMKPHHVNVIEVAEDIYTFLKGE